MRPLRSARIGYAGYSRDLSGPGDRRRFLAYAKQRGLRFEQADLNGNQDIVVVCQSGDLTGWAARKCRDPKVRVVLDLVDAYIEQTSRSQRLLIAAGRYIEGRESRFSLDFRAVLAQVCRNADAILCSSPELRQRLLEFNNHVEVSFDWLDDELGPPKHEFRRDGPLKLVWEGQSGTLSSLLSIRGVLNAVKDRVELHVVTDPYMPRWVGRFGKVSTTELLATIECPVTFHRWEKTEFSRQITDADVALLPMDMTKPIFRGKPENKLILFWKLGMPVLAAPTRAYSRVMAAAGLDMVCRSEAAWVGWLNNLAAAAPAGLAELGRVGRDYANSTYDEAAFRRPYDRIFQRFGFDPD